MRFIAFFAVVVGIWTLAHVYIARRLLVGSGLVGRRRQLAWAALVAAIVLPVISMFAGRQWPDSASARMVQWIGLTIMGFSVLLFTALVIAEIALRLRGAVMALVARTLDRRPTVDLSRRQFLGSTARTTVIGAATVSTGVGWTAARGVPSVVEIEVPIHGLPAAASGFHIVQLSDVHIGPTLRRDFMEALVERVNELRPDLVAVTGDLVDGYVPHLRDHVAPLADLRALHGSFFVTGNHEYYWGALDWCRELERLGLVVLNNAHRLVEHAGARILVAGVTDHRAAEYVPGHASNPHKACAGAPAHDAKVLLAHQPRSIYQAAAAGYDLQISGHTHAGQFFPGTALVHLFQPYVAGLAQHDSTWIYVSRGSGYWGPPLRLGSQSEITSLRLRSVADGTTSPVTKAM